MKGNWTISVLVSILILGALGLSQEVYAVNIESNGAGDGIWNDPEIWNGDLIET